jgi:hypothetical protein
LPDLLHTKSKKAGQLTGLSFLGCRPTATTLEIVAMVR